MHSGQLPSALALAAPKKTRTCFFLDAGRRRQRAEQTTRTSKPFLSEGVVFLYGSVSRKMDERGENNKGNLASKERGRLEGGVIKNIDPCYDWGIPLFG